jgi:hypothetical protein
MKVQFALVAVALLASGCSSIIEGTSQTLSFDSNPSGADCALTRNNETIGNVRTPGGVLVKKTKYDIHVLCKKDGYQDATAFLHSDAAGATFGNIVLGGGIGWAVDSASGADNKYNDHTTVTLVPVVATDGSAATGASSGTVEERLQRIKVMLDNATITKAEYDKKRSDILSGL